jgi:hypothetical protein
MAIYKDSYLLLMQMLIVFDAPKSIQEVVCYSEPYSDTDDPPQKLTLLFREFELLMSA